MIELRSVSFGYGDSLLFEGVTLTIGSGEILVLKGRSGCGKTSFLHVLNRFHTPSEGEILLDGRTYSCLRYEELRTRVIYLHQAPVMTEGLSVLDTLRIPFSFAVHREKPVPGVKDLEPMLAGFHLDSRILKQDAGELSVGEQQRVAILRAWLLRPDFLLMDEPLANLDGESAHAIQDWIAQQSREKIGLVVASHQPMASLQQGDVRFFEMKGGRLSEQRG